MPAPARSNAGRRCSAGPAWPTAGMKATVLMRHKSHRAPHIPRITTAGCGMGENILAWIAKRMNE
eukprot:scaffold220405_cov41-Tisochrysis_lutea.AAC.2